MSICMTDPFSFREHGVVIRHGVNVVAGFVGVWTRQRLRWRPRGWVMPGTEVAQYFLDDARIIDDREDAQGVLADGTAERVHMRNPQDHVAPFPGREPVGRWRGEARPARDELRRRSGRGHSRPGL